MPADGARWRTAGSSSTSRGAAPARRYRYRIDGGTAGARSGLALQPGRRARRRASVVDPARLRLDDDDWRGRPLGRGGDLRAARRHASRRRARSPRRRARLDYLRELGVTAIELMPVADFPGARNWGYDGVLPFAPDARYGTPEELKRLVEAAHARGLMVLLDVVYNHFGPEGNYLHAYAPQFFTARHHTPWGAAINFDGDGQPHRARLLHPQRAVLARGISLRRPAARRRACDPRRLAPAHPRPSSRAAVRSGPGRAARTSTSCSRTTTTSARYLARDADGAPRLLRRAMERRRPPRAARAGRPASATATTPTTPTRRSRISAAAWPRASPTRASPRAFRDGAPRGEPSGASAADARSSSFLQNHDQIGNRAFGERLSMLADPRALRAAVAICCSRPRRRCCSWARSSARRRRSCSSATSGRSWRARCATGGAREFARFDRFRDAAAREPIPDPNAPATFDRRRLDWASRDAPRARRVARAATASCCALRARDIVPRLRDGDRGAARSRRARRRCCACAGSSATARTAASDRQSAAHAAPRACGAARRPARSIRPASAWRRSHAASRAAAWAVAWSLIDARREATHALTSTRSAQLARALRHRAGLRRHLGQAPRRRRRDAARAARARWASCAAATDDARAQLADARRARDWRERAAAGAGRARRASAAAARAALPAALRRRTLHWRLTRSTAVRTSGACAPHALAAIERTADRRRRMRVSRSRCRDLPAARLSPLRRSSAGGRSAGARRC